MKPMKMEEWEKKNKEWNNPKGANEPKTKKDLKAMKKEQLITLAEAQGVELDGEENKTELVEAIWEVLEEE